MLTTAVAIFWNQIGVVVDVLSGGASLDTARPIALWVALATVALKAGLTVFTRRRAILSRNSAVEALAIDHRNDLFASIGASVGIVLSRAGLPWVDPLAGALVAVVIFETGISILRSSATELMMRSQAVRWQARSWSMCLVSRRSFRSKRSTLTDLGPTLWSTSPLGWTATAQ